VKRYSSGMYVRLAFAVAAHLDADVLIVDEVLAVCDVAFQRKCLGTMEKVADSGHTVLFVSHNMNAIRRLCTRCVYLDGGQVKSYGEVDAAIARYLCDQHSDAGSDSAEVAGGPQHQYLQLACLEDQHGAATTLVGYDELFRVRIEFSAPPEPHSFVVGVRLTDDLDNVLFTSWDTDTLQRQDTESATVKVKEL
jgi:lipopolysaccharide transport system ATP-binding protein